MENVDPLGRLVWVVRRTTTTTGEVQLESLMTDDPMIEGASQVDLEPELVAFGFPLVIEEDAPVPGETDSMVVAYDVYDNRPVMVGGEPEDAPGILINTMLMATVATATSCPSEMLPQILVQPLSATAPRDGVVDFMADADDPMDNGNLAYQWRFNGVDLDGEDADTLTVDPVELASAGLYECVISNECGFVITQSVQLTVITGFAGDTNCDGVVNNFDIDPFVIGVLNISMDSAPMVYSAVAPGECWDRKLSWGDTNHDGLFNNFDIDPFVSCIVNGVDPGVECP